MLLRQAIQRRLLGAMAFVVEWRAIVRPLGLPADGLHDGLPRRLAPRSQAVRRPPIALRTADRWIPTVEDPPLGVSLWSDRRLQGNEFETVVVAYGVVQRRPGPREQRRLGVTERSAGRSPTAMDRIADIAWWPLKGSGRPSSGRS